MGLTTGPETDLARAAFNGVLAALIGVVITVAMTFVFETPWQTGQILIAVVLSTFFGAFFSALGAKRWGR